jgi:hypothetical protein
MTELAGVQEVERAQRRLALGATFIPLPRSRTKGQS